MTRTTLTFPSDATPPEELLRRAAGQLAQAGLLLTGGNLSVRLDERQYAITPTGFVVEEFAWLPGLAPVPVDLEQPGTPEGASSETPIHSALYRRFPDVGGVCHIHSPHVLALGDDPSSWPIRTTSIEKCLPVHVVPGQGVGLAAGATALLERADDELLSRYGLSILAPGHGVFVAARSLARAVHTALRIHENAYVAVLSGRAGG